MKIIKFKLLSLSLAALIGTGSISTAYADCKSSINYAIKQAIISLDVPEYLTLNPVDHQAYGNADESWEWKLRSRYLNIPVDEKSLSVKKSIGSTPSPQLEIYAIHWPESVSKNITYHRLFVAGADGCTADDIKSYSAPF